MSLTNTIAAATLAGLVAGFPCCQAFAGEYRTLHHFGGYSQGEQPDSPLFVQGGTLYGTTAGAFAMGHFTCSYGGECGSVFAFDLTSNKLEMLHQFKPAGPAGKFPQTGLVQLGDALYGITLPTAYSNSPATLFSTSPGSRSVQVAARFPAADVAVTYFPPAALGNALYGTASGSDLPGAANEYGSVWTFNPATGKITDAYRFQGQPDGDYPLGSMLALNGVLYGTTVYGGAQNWGTIYSYNPATNTETVLHSFAGGRGGQTPGGKLVSVGTVIYGIAAKGPRDFGFVWSLDTATGAYSIVWQANGGLDGNQPADLLPLNGALIVSCGGGANGYGTIIDFDPATGKARLLKTFAGESDGIGPASLDVVSGGTVYGHTAVDSFFPFLYNGTLFALTP